MMAAYWLKGDFTYFTTFFLWFQLGGWNLSDSSWETPPDDVIKRREKLKCEGGSGMLTLLIYIY